MPAGGGSSNTGKDLQETQRERLHRAAYWHARPVQPLLAAYAHFGASVTSYWWFRSYRQGASIPFKYFTARGLLYEGQRQNRELRGRNRVHGTSGAPTLLPPGPLEMTKWPNIQVLGVNWQQNFSVQKPCYKHKRFFNFSSVKIPHFHWDLGPNFFQYKPFTTGMK